MISLNMNFKYIRLIDLDDSFLLIDLVKVPQKNYIKINKQYNNQDFQDLISQSDSKTVYSTSLFSSPFISKLKTKILKNIFLLKSTTFLTVEISLVDRCNMQCVYCYARAQKNDVNLKYQLANYDVYECYINRLFEFVKSTYKYSGLHFQFYGGQTTAKGPERDIFIKIVCLIKTLASKYKILVKFDISENGLSIDEEISNFYKLNNIHVSLSFDLPPEHTKKLRKSYMYNDTDLVLLKSMDILRSQKVSFCIRSTITSENVNSLIDSINFCLDANVYYLSMIPVSIDDNTYRHLQPDPSILYENYLKVIIYLKQLKAKNIIFKFEPLSGIENLISSGGSRYFCGLGRNIIFLDVDGRLYPCTRLRYKKYNIGNIDNFDFYNYFTKKPLISSLDICDILNSPEISCSSCEYLIFCGGGCYATALSEKVIRNPLLKDYKQNCLYTKMLFNFMVKEYYQNYGNAGGAGGVTGGLL